MVSATEPPLTIFEPVTRSEGELVCCATPGIAADVRPTLDSCCVRPISRLSEPRLRFAEDLQQSIKLASQGSVPHGGTDFHPYPPENRGINRISHHDVRVPKPFDLRDESGLLFGLKLSRRSDLDSLHAGALFHHRVDRLDYSRVALQEMSVAQDEEQVSGLGSNRQSCTQ